MTAKVTYGTFLQNASYVNQTRCRKRFAISKVAADQHEINKCAALIKTGL